MKIVRCPFCGMEMNAGSGREEKVLEEECRRSSFWDRKGLSREDWGAFEREIQSRRLEFWKEYIMMRDSDYDCDYLLGIPPVCEYPQPRSVRRLQM